MRSQTKKIRKTLTKRVNTYNKSRKQIDTTKNRKRKHNKIENLEEVDDESLISTMVNSVGKFFNKFF